MKVFLHTLFIKKKYGWNLNDYPVAKNFGKNVLSLPITPLIKDNDIDYIIGTVKKYLK